MSKNVTFAGTKMDFGAHPNMQTQNAPTGVAGAARETNPQAATTSNSHLSCNTCKEAFSSVEELRKHFSSELHVRNIRARVEGQPTLDKTEYRKSNFGSGASGFSRTGVNPSRTGDPAFGGPAPIFTCNLCQRTYKTAQTLQSHLRSTEHLIKKEQKIIERGSQAGSIISSMSLGSAAVGLHRRHKAHKHKEDKEQLRDANGKIIPVYESVLADDGETVIQRQVNRPHPHVPVEDREADVTPTRCFFSGYKSPTIKHNLDHMLEFYDFTIPLLDQVKDLVGLMEYICKKINVAICLVCGENTKKYATLEALRGHMRTADHQRMVLSPEYQEFYSCVIDDGKEANVEKIRDGATGQLVIKTASGGAICQREDGLQGAVRNVRNETTTQREERKMITERKMEENAVILKERQELMAPERKAEIKNAREQLLRHQRHQMKLSVRQSKFHPKGYDGEGEVN